MPLDDAQLESLLRRYRPAGPPDDLRTRILERAVEPVPLRCWRYAAAAILAASVGMQIAAMALHNQTVRMVTYRPTLTPEAQVAVEILGGDEAAERYVLLAMTLDQRRAMQALSAPHGNAMP